MTRLTTSATRCSSVSSSSVVLSTSATSIRSASTSTREVGVEVAIRSIFHDNSPASLRNPPDVKHPLRLPELPEMPKNPNWIAFRVQQFGFFGNLGNSGNFLLRRH